MLLKHYDQNIWRLPNHVYNHGYSIGIQMSDDCYSVINKHCLHTALDKKQENQLMIVYAHSTRQKHENQLLTAKWQ